MTGWHTGTFFGWDTETTGPDPTECRLVTSTVIEVTGAEVGVRDWLINPGIEIPQGAVDVHGITTDYARAAGDDPETACLEIMLALYRAWELGVPVVIYNASFDCTVLDRELRRHHGHGFEIRGPIIDPFVIDKHLDKWRKGKRTLGACCEHYGVKLEGAHSSSGDALAACRLAWRLATTYPEQLADLSTVNDLQAAWRAAWAADFQDYLRRQGKDEVVDGHWPLRPIEQAVA